jgi:hypothetical protein
MKTVTIKWLDMIDCLAKITLWALLLSNLFQESYDVALVYAVVIIAYSIGGIDHNTRVKNNE